MSGQITSWGTVNYEDISEVAAGIRYMPEFSWSSFVSDNWEVSAELALNLYGYVESGETDVERNWGGDLYRLWLRIASSNFEVRSGLQKINFGSATLLRPLMWFDRIDPRDPLKLTNGVYALLVRYYFPNNSNIWAWALYGNDETKGWEIYPSCEDDVEYGMRFQFPSGPGEIGISYHHRYIDPYGTKYAEQSFGVDGKWDLGIGLWFEGVVTDRGEWQKGRYRRMLTVGADYTFDVGNGLHVLMEHFLQDEVEEVFGSGDSDSISALAMDYPLNLFDTISTIVYYDQLSDDWSSFFQWHRTYDDWQIYLSAFCNSNRLFELDERSGSDSFSGRGIQVMFVYNY